MFVRKKSNKSGVVSIQVIDKSTGNYKVIKTIGSSSDSDQIKKLYNQGKLFISTYKGQQILNFSEFDFKETVKNSIKGINISGVHLLFNPIYSEIGFDEFGELLKQLVIIRLTRPSSKLKSSQYLKRYYSVDINEDKIYRYLDKLYKEQKERIQQISYQHTKKILKGIISVIFYDVTTIYFQIDDEDEIRKRGFSKEGKHQNPQILLGLLVSIDGYPLAYEIHEGNKFEGYIMLPIIDSFKSKYQIDKLIIVADSGLLSTSNIDELQQKGYEFILGARIKNESKTIKNKILSLNLKNGQSDIITKDVNSKIIISYSDKRAKKDQYNRERGLMKLEKRVKSGKLTKSNINNRGYNKYLKIEGDVNIRIDREKYYSDAVWDGLKGYLTNTKLSKDEVIENYNHLWKIEKAFRISKHDLKIRPIYHRLQKRIEAHITINFIAYKIYKELERLLVDKKAVISCEQAIEIAKTIYSVNITDPNTGNSYKETLFFNDEQKYLAKLFGF